MTIQELKAQIKQGEIASLYILYGTESYLKDYYVTKLTSALSISNPTFNTMVIKGEKPNRETIHAFIESPPMLDAHKWLLIKDSNIFKTSTEEEKTFWKDTLSHLPDYIILLFSEEAVDKRSALFKLACKTGIGVEFKTVDIDTICSFLNIEVKKQQKTMDKNCMLYFIDKVGDQLEDIVSELQKLLAYCSGKIITPRDVDAVVSTTIQNRVFVMIDAIMNRNVNQAMQLLKEIKTLNEPYQKISYLTMMSFERLLKARILLDSKMPMPSILSSLELNPYIAKKYVTAAQKFSKEKLMTIMKNFATSDYELRSGIGDEWFTYEKMIIIAASK